MGVMKATARWLPWLAVATIVSAIALFFAFMASSAMLGGDALNGRVVGGHYYVSNHGSYQEVSASEWNLNHTLGVAMTTIWPAGMVAAAFMLFRYVFPFMMTGQTTRPASPRVAAITASGAPVWSGSPGGRVGGVSFSRAMLGVEIYAAGIVLRPRFMTPIAIEAAEITSVLPGWRIFPTIEISHTSAEATSPVVLYARQTSDLGRAFSAIAMPRSSNDGASSAPESGQHAAQVRALKPKPPGPLRALSAFGLVVGVIMVIVGVVEVIPKFGPFGILWTGIAAVVLVTNLRRFLRQGW